MDEDNKRSRELIELRNKEDSEGYWPLSLAILYKNWEDYTPLGRFIGLNAHCFWNPVFLIHWKQTGCRKFVVLQMEWQAIEEWMQETLMKKLYIRSTRKYSQDSLWNSRPKIWKILDCILPWPLLLEELVETVNPSFLSASEIEILKIHYLDKYALTIYRTKLKHSLIKTRVLHYKSIFKEDSQKFGMKNDQGNLTTEEYRERVGKFWQDPLLYTVTGPRWSLEQVNQEVGRFQLRFQSEGRLMDVVFCMERIFDIWGIIKFKSECASDHYVEKWLNATFKQK